MLSSQPAGAAARVMLEGAARRVRNVPNLCCKGAGEGCCCTLLLLLLLLLQGAAVRVACPLWSWLAGAAAGCCFKVLQLKWCVRFGVGMLVPLQDALQGSRNISSDLANVPRFRIGNFETPCAWRRFTTHVVKVARDHRIWPTLVN